MYGLNKQVMKQSQAEWIQYSIYVSLVVAITDIPTVWDTVGLFVVSKDLGWDFLVDVGCRV